MQIEMGDFAKVGLLYAIIGTRGVVTKKEVDEGHKISFLLHFPFIMFFSHLEQEATLVTQKNSDVLS